MSVWLVAGVMGAAAAAATTAPRTRNPSGTGALRMLHGARAAEGRSYLDNLVVFLSRGAERMAVGRVLEPRN